MRSALPCLLICVVFYVAACHATASKLNALRIGMTRAEVEQAMGAPTSVAATDGGIEFLTYALWRKRAGAGQSLDDYFVKLVDGRVVAYGKKGDFDSTKEPSNTVNLNVKSQ